MSAFTLPFIQEYPTPFGDEASDQYPSSLPRHFIEEFTQKGETVFDPFMGFGTTAFVAEDLGRVSYGIEADEERHGWSAGQLEHWQNIRCGDAADIRDFGFPTMDFCITSPPWMPKYEDWNPLYGGDPRFAGYDAYLSRMGDIFKGVRTVMKDDAIVVAHVSDLENEDGFTPLVQDFKTLISKHFSFEQDIEINWEPASDKHSNMHCLVFRAA